MKSPTAMRIVAPALLALAMLHLPLQTVHAQGSAFSYQGRLNAGDAPANGLYDLRFRLFLDPLGNNQAGSTLLTNGVAVSGGLFLVTLDFGGGMFTGTNYWLEVDVKTNGAASYAALSPLQAVTPAPYSIFAENIGSGGLAAGTYGSAMIFNNPSNQFIGTFTGNGGGLTNVNAATLGGLAANNFWLITGNSGTSAGSNFVGTVDNQPLELHANGVRGLRIEPNTNGAPNLIGGAPVNFVDPGVVGATIGGGGAVSGNFFLGTGSNHVAAIFGTIAGGRMNTVAADHGFIGGGISNTIQAFAYDSVIGGGVGNLMQSNGFRNVIGGGDFNLIEPYADHAFIAGGGNNTIVGSFSSPVYAVIGGGNGNTVQTNASYATISGGYHNSVAHDSTAATVAGGYFNNANAPYATVGGGYGNNANGYNYSVISGGFNNAANGNATTVGGGQQNTAGGGGFGNFATVSGGYSNNASAAYTTVGGGYGNSVTFTSATIGGGYQNAATNDSAVIAGGAYNLAGEAGAAVSGGIANIASAYAATVSGGKSNNASSAYATVAGGTNNTASGYGSTVGGGQNNSGSLGSATVSGGDNNIASGEGASVGGGFLNIASNFYATVSGGYINNAGGEYATVCGGGGNVAGGFVATVAGGGDNTALGQYSFAAGEWAQALHDYSFVWSDGSSFSSTVPKQFSVRAAGGVVLAADVTLTGGAVPYHNLSLSGGNALGYLYGSYPAFGDGIHLGYNYYADASGGSHVSNTGGGTSRISAGYGAISLSVGAVNTVPSTLRVYADTSGVNVYGTFNNFSDRNSKQDFAPVDPAQILDKVAQLPLSEWSYKEDPATRHLGPVAQDFYTLFEIGTDDKHIAPIDEGGVALAAIQGLNQKLEQNLKAKDAQIEQLQQQNQKLERQLEELARRMESKIVNSKLEIAN